MARLIEKKTGKSWEIPDNEMRDALASGLYEDPSSGASVTVKDESTGASVNVAADDLDTYGRDYGARGELGEEFRGREDGVRIDRENSGILAGAATVAENFVDSATLGGYGAATDAIFGDDYTTDRRERNQARSNLATIGKIGGVVVPSLLTGGAGTAGNLARLSPVGMAEGLGRSIVKSGAGKGALSQITRSAAGYGVEGAIIGAGDGVQELALDERPVTWERAIGTVSSKALYGGLIGGGIGGAGKALEKGLGRAKVMLDDATSKLRRGDVAGEFAGMDKTALQEARRHTQAELGADVVSQAKAMREESAMYNVTLGQDRAIVTGGRKSLTKPLDDARGMAANPNSLDYKLGPVLRKEEDILRRILDDEPAHLAALAKHDDALAKKVADQVAGYTDKVHLKNTEAALYASLNDIKLTKAGVRLDKADLEEFAALLRSGAARDFRAGAVKQLPQALEKNVAMQAQIAAIKNGTAPKLTQISEAIDAFGKAPPKSALEQAANATVFGAAASLASPVIGPWAGSLVASKAAGAITDIVFGRLSKVGADAGARSTAALHAFLDAGKTAQRIAPSLATRTLTSVAFGPEPAKIANELARKPRAGLVGAYQAREKELRSLVYQSPDGGTKMHPGARQEMADRLAPIRAVDPVIADQMETIGARRVEFLAAKLPKRPDLPTLQIGPDRWRPSEMAIRQFARYVAAVEDPGLVEERLADGSVTPEDAEAVRAVYPEMFEDMKLRIVESLSELRENLPYKRRLALSIFSGVPVDAAMHPAILRVLQASFDQEEGTEGGTQAPTPQPQFGSISKEEPTSAQSRAG